MGPKEPMYIVPEQEPNQTIPGNQAENFRLPYAYGVADVAREYNAMMEDREAAGASRTDAPRNWWSELSEEQQAGYINAVDVSYQKTADLVHESTHDALRHEQHRQAGIEADIEADNVSDNVPVDNESRDQT